MTSAPGLPAGRLSAAGKRAARAIFDHGPRRAKYTEHFDVAYAQAALGELARLIDTKTPGLYAEQRENVDAAVEDLHVRPERALAEIAQNADDCQATTLRFALRDGPDGRELLCAHDGTRVTLRDAVGMTFAYISGKQDDARSKGKFGIGLKTIAGMAGSFEVHCDPYHFTVEHQHPEWTEPQVDVPGVWEAASGDTLLVMRLHGGYDEQGAVDWLGEWGTSSMLFLDTLRRIEFTDSAAGRLAHLAVDVEPLPQVSMAGIDSPVAVRVVRDADDPLAVWTTYVSEMAAPARLRRAHKKRDRLTPVGIAIPHGRGPTQLFAGLPLDERCDLPFSVHGQFDPETSRAQIRKTDWNAFVIQCLADLACAVLLNLFALEPATAWPAMPVQDDGAGRDAWVVQQFTALVERVRNTIAADAELPGSRGGVGLDETVYEAAELEGIVDRNDLAVMAEDRVPLPTTQRDSDGAWRTVLDDLGCGRELEAKDAVQMFDWDDARLGERSAVWFARLIEAALVSRHWDAKQLVDRRRCLLLAGGRRISPATIRADGATLARVGGGRTLASALGLTLVADRGFVDACEAREHAAAWLKSEYVGLRDRTASDHALERFAGSTTREPIELTDEQVLMLRDEMTRLGPGRLEELGPRIGERVKIRGYHTVRGGQRREILVTPASAYLPPRIDGHGPDGFPQAVRKLAGLSWLHSSYADLLKTPRPSRKLAARPMFLALGAHASPRIARVQEPESLHDEYAAPLRRPRPATQEKALAALGRAHGPINGVRGDYDSEELVAILDHVTGLRGMERQRAGRALLLSIEREWDRRYAGRTSATAMQGHGWWREKGAIPATWLTRIQSAAFLTSETGRRRRPADLVLRSDAYVAVIGEDKSSFCKEVQDGDLSSEVAEALGFDARPRAGRIVKQIEALRAEDSIKLGALTERTAVAYAALAAYCRDARSGSTRLSGRDRIDDLRVDALMAAFSQGDGLIFIDGLWHKPSEVFRGAPIFGQRRPFVLRHARDLWEVLGVAEPSVAECVAVLDEIADEEGEPSPQLLTGIYQRIQVELADGRRPRALKKLPLWTGTEWRSARPVYSVDQEGLARSLARELPVWQAPCALSSLPNFAQAVGAEVLAVQSFEPQGIKPGHRAAASKVRPHFLAAVRYFADLLSKQHPDVHTNAPLSFDELEAFELAHAARLEVRVPLGASDARAVAVDVFASLPHQLLAFRDPAVLGRLEDGGMAIAALFGNRWATVLAPLWEIAWQRADPDDLRERVRLAREQPTHEDPLRELLESAAARKAAKALVRGRSDPPIDPAPAEPKAKNTAPRSPKPPPRRQLRDLSNIKFGDPVIGGDDTPGSRRHRRSRGLKDPRRNGNRPQSDPSQPNSLREYDEKDKETAGFKLLASALRSLDGSELEDFRDLRGIGSDAIDELRRFFELKAHEGEIPNEISLTGPEVKRAVKERGKYFLAVVGGLETGDVVVRIFAHPLSTLDFVESGSITLSGVHHKQALELRPAPADGDPAS